MHTDTTEFDTKSLALSYVGRGLHVLPVHRPLDGGCSCSKGSACGSVGKHPKTANGLNDSYNEPAKAEEYGEAWKTANVGIRTGVISGVVGIDIDPGKGGDKSWAELLEKHQMPTTWEVRTGSNGSHHYFQAPQGVSVSNRAGVLPGIDVRGDQGYLVAPPSLHRSGGTYTWVRGPETALAELPQWLLDLIASPAKQVEKVFGPSSPTASHSSGPSPMAKVGEGKRHSHMVRKAAVLLKELKGPPLEAALLKLNEEACSPPLPVAEVKKIAEDFSYKDTLPVLTAAPQTDLGNAERLVGFFDDDIIYCSESRVWFTWDCRRWVEDEDGEIVRRAEITVRAARDAAEKIEDEDVRKVLKKWLRKSESREGLSNMVKLASVNLRVVRHQRDLDADPMLLNVANGTIDLRTGELLAHRPGDYITRLSNVAYDPLATAPLWEKFLGTVLKDNEHLVAYVKRLAGYWATGSTAEQMMAIFYGTGANGKSTFMEVVADILGDQAQGADVATFLVSQSDRIRNDVARLAGARLVRTSEPPAGRSLDEGLVKKFTGQDIITARFLHAEFFDFLPTFKVVMAANHKPQINGADEGIWRRIHLVPFTVTIPESDRDPELRSKLLAEAPGILNWIVQGCLEWQRDKLSPPAEVTEATKEYRSEMDVLGEFIGEKCELVSGKKTLQRELYGAYKDFCFAENTEPISGKAFGARLGERGVPAKTGEQNKLYRLGISLKKSVQASNGFVGSTGSLPPGTLSMFGGGPVPF